MNLRFTLEDANRAYDEWGCNCGPSAVAAIMGMSLDDVRPHMGDFEQKHYTNPTLMWEVLRSIGRRWRIDHARRIPEKVWPKHGLARVQWEGPWTAPGVPMRARYRHTHWVAAQMGKAPDDWGVFDINAMNSGGWVSLADWTRVIAPWIIRELVPRGSGGWHLTHVVEIEKPDVPAHKVS
jgi:hypothetical protein